MIINIELTEKEVKALTEIHGEPGQWLHGIACREARKLRRNRLLTMSEHIGIDEAQKLIEAAYSKIPFNFTQSEVPHWGGKVEPA